MRLPCQTHCSLPGESFFPRLPLSQALEGARSTDLTNKPPQIRQQFGQRSTSSAPFPPGAKIAISPIEVVSLSKKWAYEFGTATTTYTPEGSDQALKLRDTYLILFRNTGKGWQAYREVASSTPPPSGWPDD